MINTCRKVVSWLPAGRPFTRHSTRRDFAPPICRGGGARGDFCIKELLYQYLVRYGYNVPGTVCKDYALQWGMHYALCTLGSYDPTVLVPWDPTRWKGTRITSVRSKALPVIGQPDTGTGIDLSDTDRQ